MRTRFRLMQDWAIISVFPLAWLTFVFYGHRDSSRIECLFNLCMSYWALIFPIIVASTMIYEYRTSYAFIFTFFVWWPFLGGILKLIEHRDENEQLKRRLNASSDANRDEFK